MSPTARSISWIAQIAAAVILLQTLFFKFTAAPESVAIFSALGAEPWGRIGSGIVEGIAAALLLIPATAAVGALVALGVMAGAIASHLGPLGIEVAGDGGLLFALALVVAASAATVLWLRRAQLPVLGRRLAPAAAALVLAGTVLAPSAASAAEKPVNSDRSGIAIEGYDTVAYHTEKRPVEGSKEFSHSWNGATWLFATAANRDTFAAAPAKYAPAYGGYCAYGVSKGGLYDIEPEAWSVVDGVLYLNYNLEVRETWSKDAAGFITKANGNWPGLVK